MNYDLIALLGIAAMNAFTAYLSFKTHSQIRVLEKNTNSIKDALVLSTAKASRSQGNVEGRAEEKTEQLERDNTVKGPR